MLNKLSITYGSKKVLDNIEKKNANRKFALVSNNSQDNSYALIDFSNETNIFSNPNEFDVLFNRNENYNGGLFFFNYFDLSEEQITLFDDRIKKWATKNNKSIDVLNTIILRPLNEKNTNRVVLNICAKSANESSFELMEFKKIINQYKNINYFKTNYSK